MPCYHLRDAWQLPSGRVIFEEDRARSLRKLRLPCGQCIGCRLERSRQWAVRIMHESAMFEKSCFVTLTYDDDHVPERGLDHRDFQLFMKRLRRRCGKFRYFMCGEYGEKRDRPHFHACLFGFWPLDSYQFGQSKSGFPLFRSSILESLWKFGHSSFGALSFESAAYVASYCLKKVTGSRAVSHYERLDLATGEIYVIAPEYSRMSLKPGVGSDFLDKFRSDVWPRDYAVVNGVQSGLPRFYRERLLSGSDFETVFQVSAARNARVVAQKSDSTPERLAVREKVVNGRLGLKSRSL